MSLVRSVRVTRDIGGPFVLCGVCVACSDVFILKGLELLLGAEFVGHLGDEPLMFPSGRESDQRCFKVVG